MKTDSELKSDVLEEMRWDSLVPAARVGVAVNAGVVSLHGHVHAGAERNAAEGAAWSVPGVSRVHSELTLDA